jgi:homoserine dehydrogenase
VTELESGGGGDAGWSAGAPGEAAAGDARPRAGETDPRPIVVLKFGSSLLRGPAGFAVAAAEATREVDLGHRVVAVCSAQRGVTDALLKDARSLCAEAPPELTSRILATGEAASVPMLALALAARGVAAHVLDVTTLGLRTRGALLDADPVALDTEPILALFRTGPVVVAPGFVGVHENGAPSLLGRGGSDLTALFVAHCLDADECRLVKDVDGIYPSDPDLNTGEEPYRYTSWDTARAVGGVVVQTKAVHLAERWNRPFRVAAPGGVGTWVGVTEASVAQEVVS